LLKDKKITAGALEKAQTERNAASEQVATLRAEAVQLDQLLQDKRTNLESETKLKLAEFNQAEAKLREITARVTAAEKRVHDLADVEKNLQSAALALQNSEKQRLAEDKTVSELKSEQDKLRKDITLLDDGLKAGQMQLADLTKKAKAEEALLADLTTRAEKATAAMLAAEAKRLEAEAAINKARDEEKNLRKGIPALTTEMAGLQAALVALNRDRDEASQYVTRLNVATDHSNRKISELQQQISQLEEAQRIREERVMKIQTDVDGESARFKAVQDQTRSAESALQELDRQLKESRQKADTARTQVQNLEAELTSRLDRVQSLKVDEERLNKELAARQQDVQLASSAFAEMQDKISTEEKRVKDYTHVGGQILSFGAALAGLETRQAETAKSLREAAERELALQVKINSLQETFNRESAKVEEMKKSRAALENELAAFTNSAQKQTASLQALEAEHKRRLTDLNTQLNQQTSLSERIKVELSGLQDRRAEFAQAEAQLRHWQEIEARLRGQLLDLEEKHEIMRRGLSTEESTVVMFAHDIIKRVDLIDALTARYSSQNGGDVVTQLGTLRASFEDILLQHGITEFDIAAGTEVDTQLRKRIAVVDSVPGKQKPRVVETCRSGFIYSREEGHEVILRKVEVKTSSQ
jgi:chromosome segregation ATPase